MMRYPPPEAPARSARRGLSLLEVLVALAIFLFSLIVVGRLVVMGADTALDVQYQSQAAQLCQSKMAEVMAGVVPLNPQNEVPFDEDPEWTWTLDCEQNNIAGLWNVTVKVSHLRGPGFKNECSLNQMMLDPSIRGSALDQLPSTSSSSDTGTGSGGSSTQGGSSTTGSGSSPSAGSVPSGPAAPAAAAPRASSPSPAASAPAAAPSAPAASPGRSTNSNSGKKGG
jgi:prepilin-type N-terminal cleavage/methylation domain-containing protein